MNHQSKWAEKNDILICPHCNYQYDSDSSDYFWHDYKKSEDTEDTYQRQLECEECEELFDVSMDRHNVNDGYSCSIPDCESLKLKHKMKFQKEHKNNQPLGDIDYHIYECSKCEKRDFVAVDEKGKKLTPLKEALLRKKLSKSAKVVDKAEKQGEYFSYISDYFFESSINIKTNNEEGNLQIVDSLHKLVTEMGFKTNKPKIDKMYNYVNTNPKGKYKNYTFQIDNYPAGLDIKIKVDKNRDTEKLTYLEHKFLKLILLKAEKVINQEYPLITKRPKQEMGHWNRPNLDSVESHEEKVKLLKAHVDKNPTEGYNTRDKNGINLKNGETRYFYNYQGKLSRGEVHHHINNMWWVISGDEINNIACFNLFLYNKTLSLKKPVDLEKRLKAEIQKYIELEDFERCIKIKKQLKSLAS